MFTVGMFYAWDFLVLIICTLCYIYFPVRWLAPKIEWIKFLLIFLSCYFTLFWILCNELQGEAFVYSLFFTAFCPCLLLSYIAYPFRESKRNSHVLFFLSFATFYVLLLKGSVFIGWFFSNM